MTRDQAKADNRARFPVGAEALAWADKHFPCTAGTRGHSVMYAENAQGEKVGKRDMGPWCEYRPMGDWA